MCWLLKCLEYSIKPRRQNTKIIQKRHTDQVQDGKIRIPPPLEIVLIVRLEVIVTPETRSLALPLIHNPTLDQNNSVRLIGKKTQDLFVSWNELCIKSCRISLVDH